MQCRMHGPIPLRTGAMAGCEHVTELLPLTVNLREKPHVSRRIAQRLETFVFDPGTHVIDAARAHT